ncbi:MAG: thioesterase family protein [Litorimonas sp.]
MSDDRAGFQTVLNNSCEHGGGYKTHITQNWKQGRTCYGGLTLALAYDAALKTINPLPPLRSIQINFVGPVTHNPIFTAQILRQGRNVTSAHVTGVVEEIAGEPKHVASANFIFGTARISDLSVKLRAPSAPSPQACDPFTSPTSASLVPQFFHNFDTRLIAGKPPMSGALEGYIRTWSRHKDPASREGLASLLCISDVLPPAAMPMFKKMGPISSMNFTLNILADTPKTQDGWWHIETHLSAAQDGYSSQTMRIWNTNGQLVAEGMQCVAIFMLVKIDV